MLRENRQLQQLQRYFERETEKINRKINKIL
jgi:hypothetical protein